MNPSYLHLPQVGSTNDEVLARARAGAADGLWISADVQSSGRGRQGRVWQGRTGNLTCSGLVRPVSPEGHHERPLAQLSFVAALAVHEALTGWVAPDRLALKWPNDLLLDGHKCAGILLEAASTGKAPPEALAVGIGVNLAWHPQDTDRPATSLTAALGKPAPLPDDVIRPLAEAFGRWRALWREQGFAPVGTAWSELCPQVGKRVDARLGRETLSGVMTGLGEGGALLLTLDDGSCRAIHAGDVFDV